MSSTGKTTEERIKRVEENIRSFQDFPKPGISFKDIFPIMKDHKVFTDCIDLLVEHIKDVTDSVDVIVGLDARGFIFGPLVAQRLKVAFVPIRKSGKLPGETVQAKYTLEYGSDMFEAQKDAVKEGQKLIIIDDLLATGGTMAAACNLMKKMKADILECLVVIELEDLEGRKKVPEKVHSLIKVKG